MALRAAASRGDIIGVGPLTPGGDSDPVENNTYTLENVNKNLNLLRLVYAYCNERLMHKIWLRFL